MMNLLDVVIRLGDVREVRRSYAPSGKKPFERSFRSTKPKFMKREWDTREESKGGSSGKPTTPKSFVKRPKRVDAKVATKK